MDDCRRFRSKTLSISVMGRRRYLLRSIIGRYIGLQTRIVKSILKEFEDDMISIMSVGGVSREEVKEDWSDVDLLIVIQDSANKESLEKRIEGIGRRVTRGKTLRLRPDQTLFSPWVFTKTDVGSGRAIGQGFEYLNFVRDSSLLYGEDVRDWLKPPDQKAIVRTAQAGLRQAASQYKNKIGSVEILDLGTSIEIDLITVGWFFSLLFPVTRMLLALKGCFVASKKDMASHARLVQEIPGWNVVPEAYKEWLAWDGSTRNPAHTRDLCCDMRRFLENAFATQMGS